MNFNHENRNKNYSTIETVIIPNFDEIDINEAVKLFQISWNFKESERYKNLEDDILKQYEQKRKNIISEASRFFASVCDTNIIEQYRKLDFFYEKGFWRIFDNLKMFNKISEKTFLDLINCCNVAMNEIFQKKDIVEKYGEVLRQFLKNNLEYVGLFLNACDIGNNEHNGIYLPKELTGEDIISVFDRYIESESPNPNFLLSISRIKTDKRIQIDNELRFRAKKKYDIEIDKLSSRGIKFEKKHQVSILKGQKEAKKYHLPQLISVIHIVLIGLWKRWIIQAY